MGIPLADVRDRGWKALVKELGCAGATKYVLLYEGGKGNYVEERKGLFREIALEDIVIEIKKSRRHGCGNR